MQPDIVILKHLWLVFAIFELLIFHFVCAQRSISFSYILGVDWKSGVDATQWLAYCK